MSDTSNRISALVDAAGPGHVWVPSDFAHLGARDLVDKTLQRMVARGELRRIERGLYDRPVLNRLTGRLSVPDYRSIIDALSRRDQVRMLIDGMTAANDLGLTDAVPARVVIHTETRRRAIKLDKLMIDFKLAAPSRLYWASRPAMRVVQALHWLKDMLPSEGDRIRQKISRILSDGPQGEAIRDDLAEGFSVLPGWMQGYLRTIPEIDPQGPSASRSATSGVTPSSRGRNIQGGVP